jgi:uncharacterized protein (TIGR02145 family)
MSINNLNFTEMKKKSFLIYPLLIMGVLLIFAGSCKNDDVDNGGNNGVIPVLTTTAVTDQTQTTAKSGGNITSGGSSTVTARGVCWSTGQTPTVSDNKTIDGSGAGEFTSSISGLSANTTYYVKAYATNSAGTGYGSAMYFTTLQGNSGSSFTDTRDGTVYKTVTIGNQVWMAENLRYLPTVNHVADGSEDAAGSYYYVYGYDGTDVNAAKATSNYATYGVLYNWTAAVNSCPAGWHLSSDAEWRELTDYLGGISVAGGKLKEAGTTHWLSPNTEATKETGFTALPCGIRYYDGAFYDIGDYGYWWSATEDYASRARFHYIYSSHSFVYKGDLYKVVGFSVRCVRD